MNLLTIDDIASMFRVDRRTVADRWIHRPDFPAPAFAPTRRTRRWERDQVIAWARPAGQRSAQPSPGNTQPAAG